MIVIKTRILHYTEQSFFNTIKGLFRERIFRTFLQT
jgi:hypothetical protein